MRSVRQNQYRLLKGTDPTNPTREEKRKQMLESGKWREGESGELIRVNQPIGLPSDERLKELEMMDRPLTESEAREYASAAFDPSSSMNMLFGLAAGLGFDPVGEAAMGLIGSGAKAVNKGVRAMKSTSTSPSVSSIFGGDPDRAAAKGTLFVRKFYSDPYIQKHFDNIYGRYDLNSSTLPETFQRGSSAPIPQPLNLKEVTGLDVEGAYFPGRDKAYISDDYYTDWARSKEPYLDRKVSSISAHEMTHYADNPIFSAQNSEQWGVADEMGSKFDRVSNATPDERMVAYYQMRGLPPDQIEKYWDYVSSPIEMAANAMSVRETMKRAIFNSDKPRIAELFKDIRNDKSFSKIMIGDFSGLSDLQFKMLMDEVYGVSDQHVKTTLRHVLKGANDSSTYDYSMGKIWNNPEKKKSISDWLKYALMIPVAGTAAASQAEMIDGGKLKLLKKK